MNFKKFYIITIVVFTYFFFVVSYSVYADSSEFEVSPSSETEYSDTGEGGSIMFPENATLSPVQYDLSDIESKLNDIYKSLEQINKDNSEYKIHFQDIDSLFMDIKKDVSSIHSKMIEEEIQKKEIESQQEVSLSDLHDDNIKIMVCIFVLLGVLLGFLMISRVLS